MHAKEFEYCEHTQCRSATRSVGRSLTSCIGENGTHNHLPHAKAFGNNLYPLNCLYIPVNVLSIKYSLAKLSEATTLGKATCIS